MNTEKISAGLAALVVGLAFFGLALNLRVPLDYSEFVVGNITWYAGNKFQDLIAWPVFIFSSFGAYICFAGLTDSMRERHGAETSARLASQFVLWTLPFFAAAAALYWTDKIESKVTTLSAVGIIAIGIVAYLQRNAEDRPDPSSWGAALFAFVLVALIPLEVAMLLSRMPMSLVGHFDPKLFFNASYGLALALLIIGAIILGRRPQLIKKHYRELLLVGQIGLPLFYLTLYPARLSLPTGELTKYETAILLNVVLALAIIYGIADIFRRFRSAAGQKNPISLFSPFAIFGLLVALKLGYTVAPHIHPDDYHFGENLLGLWSYLQGYVPYLDQLPAHGIIENDMRATLSLLLYDGSAGAVAEAGRMTFAILGLAAFLSIYRVTGSLVLAFVALLPLGHRFGLIFLIPFICLWLSSNLRSQPAKWLIVFGITAPIVILGVPPQGVVAVAAFGILAAKLTWDQIRTGDGKSWKQLLLAAGIVLIVIVFTPLLWMILGAVQYVLENGQINQQAYGIPWTHSWYAELKGYGLEAIRNTWFFIPLAGVFVAHAHYKGFGDARSVFYTALVLIVFCFLMISYSMGRIDPGSISRSGLVSIFSWAVLFPLLMWALIKAEMRALLFLLVVVMTSLTGAGVSSLAGLVSAASQSITVEPLRDADAAGVRNIGRSHVEDEQWSRITRLNALLEARLEPGEPYLDLTSRNAHYFYVDRLPPIPVSAPYNLVHPKQEKRAVEKLRNNPPKLALLEADNIIHDGGGLALRNPQLYRFAVETYVPVMERGFIVGYRKSDIVAKESIIAEARVRDDRGVGRPVIELSDKVLAAMLSVGDRIRISGDDIRAIQNIHVAESIVELDGGVLPTPNASADNLVEIAVSPRVYREYTASLLERSFARSEFHKIPVSWGRAEKSLSRKMTLVQDLDKTPQSLHDLVEQDDFLNVVGQAPHLLFDLSGLELSGRDAGLLKFDLSCAERKTDIRLRISWWGDDRDGPFDSSRVTFTADNGALIVPLDASPWWLTLAKVKGLTLELEGPSACSSFKIENIGLYQRIY
jgi:hypothetical protein